MKLTPYKEILSMKQDDKDALLLPIKINTAKKQAELTVAKIEEKIATLENEITTLSSSPELNLEKIADKFDELGLIERRKKQFTQIITELFPE
jgi:3-isopropylmalate dehydratase small subunit